MASTYSQLKIELIGTGEQSGTWGATTNTNLGTAIEEAITGTIDVPFSDADITLTLSNTNTSQTARNLRLHLTGTATTALNLTVPDIEKFYLIANDLAYEVVVKNTTGTDYTVPAGTTAQVFSTGAGIKDGISFFQGELLSSAAYILGGEIDNTPIGPITPSTGKFTTITDTGNLTFTGTANRITGDFSNATYSNRVAFQTSTADSNTAVGVLPNGSATGSSYQVYNNSTLTNASLASLEASSSAVTLASSIRGSGTYLPMAFNVNGSESLRLLTTGAVSFGSSGTAYGTSGQVLTSQGSGAAPTWTAANSGTVTSITAGTGLSGGTITASGTIAINTAVTVDVSTAQTLTNKRITPRSLAAASATGTVTPNSDSYDQVNYLLTGTVAFAVPSGTPTNGQKLNIRLYAASTQTVSWTTSSTGYRVICTTLPTSVASGKTVYVGCVWNSTDSYWDVVAVATQA